MFGLCNQEEQKQKANATQKKAQNVVKKERKKHKVK